VDNPGRRGVPLALGYDASPLQGVICIDTYTELASPGRCGIGVGYRLCRRRSFRWQTGGGLSTIARGAVVRGITGGAGKRRRSCRIAAARRAGCRTRLLLSARSTSVGIPTSIAAGIGTSRIGFGCTSAASGAGTGRGRCGQTQGWRARSVGRYR
jgi:hypothetical protein